MTNKMERFSPQARQVLTSTHAQAASLGQKHIIPGHMLLAMLQTSGCIAHQALTQAGLNYSQVLAIVRANSPAEDTSDGQQVELSAETRRLLEGAVDQARRLGHHYVGTEHLLLALMNEPDSATRTVLEQTAVSRETIRQYTRQILEQPVQEALESQFRLMPPPAASPERMKVLEMIDAGKITADEGIRLLEAMKLTSVVPPPIPRIIKFWSHRLH